MTQKLGQSQVDQKSNSKSITLEKTISIWIDDSRLRRIGLLETLGWYFPWANFGAGPFLFFRKFAFGFIRNLISMSWYRIYQYLISWRLEPILLIRPDERMFHPNSVIFGQKVYHFFFKKYQNQIFRTLRRALMCSSIKLVSAPRKIF